MKHLGYSELTKRLYILPASKRQQKIDITDDVKEYLEFTVSDKTNEQLAIDLIPIYPIDNAFIKSLTWGKYIECLRNAFISGLNHQTKSDGNKNKSTK